MECSTKGCKKKALKNRTICSACKQRKWREKHPIKAAYYDLKTNARRRGKEFNLTLEEFTKFCIDTGYDEKRGRFADCLSIDRKRPEEGYSLDNIRAITVSENVKLMNGSLDNYIFTEFQPRETPF